MVLQFAPRGRILASGSKDQKVKLWDFSNPEKLCLLQELPHDSTVSSLAFSLDGRLLASGSANSKIHLWSNIGMDESKFATASDSCWKLTRTLDVAMHDKEVQTCSLQLA